MPSNSISYIGKTTKSKSRWRDWRQTASLIWARPQNPILGGDTGIKQPLSYRQGPKIPVWPARLASYNLSYVGKTTRSKSRRRDWRQTACLIYARPQNPSLAGETGLKQPLLYRQAPQIPVSPARLASNSLFYIGNTPKARSRRQECPQTASLISARPQNPSLAGETGVKQPLLYGQGPKIPFSAATLASNSLSHIGKAPKSQSGRRDWPHTTSHM